MRNDIKTLFERLLHELPRDTATLDIRPVPRNGGAVIELKPAKPAAADFGVHCDDFEVYSFGFGPMSQWEFPYERRYRKGEKDILTEIEEMSRAIIAGKCEVTRHWFSLTGRIYAEGYTYETKDLPMFPRPPFGTRRYASYTSEKD
jgi:hypothetical protein